MHKNQTTWSTLNLRPVTSRLKWCDHGGVTPVKDHNPLQNRHHTWPRLKVGEWSKYRWFHVLLQVAHHSLQIFLGWNKPTLLQILRGRQIHDFEQKFYLHTVANFCKLR